MIPSRSSRRSPARAAHRRWALRTGREPQVAIVAWSCAPWPRALSIAIVSQDAERASRFREAFGDGNRAPREARSSKGYAWDLLVRAGPDAVVLDCGDVPDVATMTRLLARLPGHPAVVVLAPPADLKRSMATMVAGAGALLPTHAPPAEVRDAVACVLRGEAVVPRSVAREAVRLLRRRERDA